MLVIVTLALLVTEQTSSTFTQVRAGLAWVTMPIQLVVRLPIQAITWLQDRVISNERLLRTKQALQQENFVLRYQLQQVANLAKENIELRELLGVAKSLTDKVSAARLFAIHLGNTQEQALIDKGANDGLFIGQPVLDASGVIGQIITTDANSSTVLFITDVKSAIPVVIARNGLPAIAVGLGRVGLELLNLPETADIKEGDQLITSGLGSRFAYGYTVGVVKSVTRIVGERFVKVIVVPAAHIYTSRFVLLVWPQNA